MNIQSVNNTNPFNETATDSPAVSSTRSAGSTSSSSSSGVDQNQFLKLLVTQLKNQDPMSPTDSTQFMGELAQFTQLQEVMGIHQDVNTLLNANGIQVPTTSSGS
jgi:flagellar basal-body rod modification protein FlgD